MPLVATVCIHRDKIDRTALINGKNGPYLLAVLFSNRDGKDQYDNDGFVRQDLPRERRDQGERGTIIGNFKLAQQRDLPPHEADEGFFDDDKAPF